MFNDIYQQHNVETIDKNDQMEREEKRLMDDNTIEKELVPKDDSILGKGTENDRQFKNQNLKIKEYKDYSYTLDTICDDILYNLLSLPNEKLEKCIEKINSDGFSQFFKAFLYDYYYKIKLNNNLKMIILINIKRLETMVYNKLNNRILSLGIRFDGMHEMPIVDINVINSIKNMQEELKSSIINSEFEKGPIQKYTVKDVRDEVMTKFKDEWSKL